MGLHGPSGCCIRTLLKKDLGFARFFWVTRLLGTRNPKTQKLAVSFSFYPNKKKNSIKIR